MDDGYMEEGEGESESHVWSHVYSFTRHDVDMALGESTPWNGADGGRRVSEAKKAMEWLRFDGGSKKDTQLSFFSGQFERHSSAFNWTKHTNEINWTGNESDGRREDSVYIAYAIVVLGEGGGVACASIREEEEAESEGDESE